MKLAEKMASIWAKNQEISNPHPQVIQKKKKRKEISWKKDNFKVSTQTTPTMNPKSSHQKKKKKVISTSLY